MPKRPVRHLLAEAFASGLESLEPRRVLDGASCSPACDELIEITRLDGGESFWVRADDAEYGIVDCEDADHSGDDSDLYSFTTRPTGERPRDASDADEPGDDHDLYDFGQDRGPEIDDDAEYETVPDPAPITDSSGVPTEAPAERSEVAPIIQPVIEVPASTAIALVPTASAISWLGGVNVKSPASAIELADKPEADSPASWTDLAELPEPAIATQP